MRNNFYNVHNYGTDNSAFVSIYRHDFDRHLTMSEVASRIISDRSFDVQCKRNAKSRDFNKQNAENKQEIKT